MKQNTVVQLGAGPIQRILVERLLEEGLGVILVDRAADPAGRVPGAIHVRAGIDDPQAIVSALHEVLPSHPSLEVRAVQTSTALGVASVPEVCRALGLPHASPDSIAAMDDKFEGKNRLANSGVRVPRGQILRRGDPRADFALGGEVVVKPVDSSGSRGVRRVSGADEVEAAIEHAFTFSERILIEECILGDHLVINGYVVDGRFELVSIGARYFTPPPACVPIYGGIDGAWDSSLSDRVQNAMQAGVDAFGYSHGLVKADAIDSGGELVILEMAARFHGDVFSMHLARAAGQLPASLQWLARQGLCEPTAVEAKRGAWFAVFADRAGKIASIDGIEAFREDTTFRDWIPRLVVGDEVAAPEDNRALVGFGLIRVPEEKDLFREAIRVREGITVGLE